MRLHRLVLLALLLALFVKTSSALAVSNPAAEALFDRAREAMDAGDYTTACEQFRESDRLEPAVGTRFNLANCEEKRGRLATAWTLYRSVVNDLEPGDDRRPFAEARVKALAERVPHVTLVPRGEPADDVVVQIGELELTSGSFNVALALDPGTHQVEVRRPGAEAQALELVLEEGESRELVFDIPVAGGKAAAGAASTAPSEPPADSGSSGGGSGRKTLGYIVGGVGMLGLAGGTAAGILVLQQKQIANENCWPPDEDYPAGGCNPRGADANTTGKQLGPLATAGLAVGAVGIGFGLYLILSSSSDETPRAALGVHPTVGGTELSFTGAF